MTLGSSPQASPGRYGHMGNQLESGLARLLVSLLLPSELDKSINESLCIPEPGPIQPLEGSVIAVVTSPLPVLGGPSVGSLQLQAGLGFAIFLPNPAMRAQKPRSALFNEARTPCQQLRACARLSSQALLTCSGSCSDPFLTTVPGPWKREWVFKIPLHLPPRI